MSTSRSKSKAGSSRGRSTSRKDKLPVSALRALETEFATVSRSRTMKRSRSRSGSKVRGLTTEKQTFLRSKAFKVILIVAFGLSVGTAVYQNQACRRYISEQIVSKLQLPPSLTSSFTRMKLLATKAYEQVRDIATGRIARDYRQASGQYNDALIAYQKRLGILEEDITTATEELARLQYHGPQPHPRDKWLDIKNAEFDLRDSLEVQFNAQNDPVVMHEWEHLKPILEQYKSLPPLFRDRGLDRLVKVDEGHAHHHQYLIEGPHAQMAQIIEKQLEQDQIYRMYQAEQQGKIGPMLLKYYQLHF